MIQQFIETNSPITPETKPSPTLRLDKAFNANDKFEIMENTIEKVKTRRLKETEYTNKKLTINIKE
jgi:hypothetical protein